MFLILGLYFVLLILNYLLTKALLKYRKLWLRIFVSVTLGILLTILAVFTFNHPSYIQKSQVELLKYWGRNNQKYTSHGYDYIKNRFIIVDNSYDKQIIERPDIGGDSSNTAISDRYKLFNFFRFVNQHIEEVDLIVCDIGFVDQTIIDTVLKQEMDKVYFRKKLLVSYDEQNSSGNIIKFDKNIQGNVREAANDYRFISHTIKNGSNQSLAYKIYAFENNIKNTKSILGGRLFQETDSNNNTKCILNTFIPKFSLTDESLLIGEQGENSSFAYADTDIEYHGFNWLTLGSTATVDGQENLLINLKQRKINGQKNYLLLGSFKNPDEDIHNTIYKPMHGVSILLNTIYDLHRGINRITVFDFILISFSFSLITFLLISLSLKYPVKQFNTFLSNSSIFKRLKKWIKKIFPGIGYIFNSLKFVFIPLKFIFFEKLHFLLLLLQFILIARYTGLIFNIMYFVIHFLFFEISMKYYVKTIEHKT